MESDTKREVSTAQGIVFDVATELRALAYLFETQGTKANVITEEDMDQVSYGMGQIIKRYARRLRRTHRLLDRVSRKLV